MKLRSTRFLAVLLIGLVGCSDSDNNSGNESGNNSESESLLLTNPLDGIQPVQRVSTGFRFLEGPAYRASDNSLFFSDIPVNTIFQLTPDGSIESFRENQPTNGLIFDQQGRLLIATNSGRTLSRLIEFPERPANVTLGGPENNTLFVTARTGLYTVELQ